MHIAQYAVVHDLPITSIMHVLPNMPSVNYTLVVAGHANHPVHQYHACCRAVNHSLFVESVSYHLPVSLIRTYRFHPLFVGPVKLSSFCRACQVILFL